jgi:hypothetical protein
LPIPIPGLPGLPGLPVRLERPKPHDVYSLVTSGRLEQLGFKYRPATPSTLFRHPSKLGLRP